MTNVIGIIQVRMGSSRLPGKVLLPVGGRTALAYLVGRVSRAESLQQLVVATSVHAEDDPIVEECIRLGINYFRGSESNVLGRLAQASRMFSADVIVRITGDDVLMDPKIVEYMVKQFRSGQYDCATGLTTYSFPNGFVVCVLSVDALCSADKMELDPFKREHIVPAFLDHRDIFSILDVTAPPEWSQYDVGFALDCAADYALICDVVRLLEDHDDKFGLIDILKLVLDKPDLYERSRRLGHYWD